MDLKSVFLNGNIQEYMYMKHPEGYISDPTLVCRLNKYLYGLKQAPRAWYAKMDSFLLSQNSQDENQISMCIYNRMKVIP